MNPFSPFLPPNPLHPRPSGGAGAEGLKKQFPISPPPETTSGKDIDETGFSGEQFHKSWCGKVEKAIPIYQVEKAIPYQSVILRKVIVALVFIASALPAHAQSRPPSPFGPPPATLVVPTQYATIKEAMAAAQSGDTIEIREGTYESQIVNLKDGVTVTGAGREKVIVRVESKYAALIARGCQTGKVSGITFEHTTKSEKPTADWIAEIIDSSVQVVDCRFRNSGGFGVTIEGNSRPTFLGCSTEGCTLSGFHVSGAKAQPEFEDCVAERNQKSGFAFFDGAGGSVRSCRSSGNRLDGIAVVSGTPTMTGNTLSNNGGWGVEINAGATPTLGENKFEGNKEGEVFSEALLAEDPAEKDTDIGITFPKELAGLKFEGKKEYITTGPNPVNLYSLLYLGDLLSVDIRVAGQSQVTKSPDGAQADNIFLKRVVMAPYFLYATNPGYEDVEEGAAGIAFPGTAVPYMHQVISMNHKFKKVSIAQEDYATSFRGHFIGISASYGINDRDPARAKLAEVLNIVTAKIVEAKKGPVNPAASIGSATMEEDGTIILILRAAGPGGLVGDGRLVYPPTHAEYQSILQHVGPLDKGDTVRVNPWPEKK